MRWIKRFWNRIKAEIVTPDPHDEQVYLPSFKATPTQRMMEKLSFNGYRIFALGGPYPTELVRLETTEQVELASGIGFIALADIPTLAEFWLERLKNHNKELFLGVTDLDNNILYVNPALPGFLVSNSSFFGSRPDFLYETGIDVWLRALKKQVEQNDTSDNPVL